MAHRSFGYALSTVALATLILSSVTAAAARDLPTVNACNLLTDDEVNALVGQPLVSKQEIVQEPVHICLGDYDHGALMVRVENEKGPDAWAAIAQTVNDPDYAVNEATAGVADSAVWQVLHVGDPTNLLYPEGTELFGLWFVRRDTIVYLAVTTALYQQDEGRAKTALLNAAQRILGRLP